MQDMGGRIIMRQNDLARWISVEELPRGPGITSHNDTAIDLELADAFMSYAAKYYCARGLYCYAATRLCELSEGYVRALDMQTRDGIEQHR
eukprot:SAG11_NODE_2042_length_3888_cov_2.370810_4_plen_91_part_00